MNNDELASALLWHFECKQYAISQIVNLRPPADAFQMRIAHTIYLTNLVSATEIIAEIFRPQFDQIIQDRNLAELYAYVRELRNAVVHRGLDPCAIGHVVAGEVVAVAAEQVTDRTGKKAWGRPDRYLRNVFARCEDEFGRLIFDIIEGSGGLTALHTPTDRVDEIRRTFLGSADIPDYAKEMFIQFQWEHTIDLAEISNQQVDHLNNLLLRGCPDGLAVPG